MIARSFLFAPADSPAKMEKARGSGADAIILDIEDSVAIARKPEARLAAAEFLRTHKGAAGPELWVRINPLSGPFADDDLAAIAPAAPFGVVLPKPNSPADANELSARLASHEHAAGLAVGSIAVLPIATETPRSVFTLGAYADAPRSTLDRIAGLTWGAEDLSAAIGAVTARDEAGELTDPYRIARALCLIAAAAAETPAVETVFPDFRNLEGLERYVARGRRDGFQSMMAIHPSQVDVINRGFTPSESEIAFARKVVDLFAANPDAATLALDGKMLDLPHLMQARRTLERAKRSSL